MDRRGPHSPTAGAAFRPPGERVVLAGGPGGLGGLKAVPARPAPRLPFWLYA